MTPDTALSLANDLACAIATLREIEDELRTSYPSADYRRDDDGEPTADTPQVKSEPKPEVTLEKVRSALADKSRNGHREAVQALLTKYGAERLSAVDPKHYADLLSDAEGIT
jgi:hypothetical protein